MPVFATSEQQHSILDPKTLTDDAPSGSASSSSPSAPDAAKITDIGGVDLR